MSTLFADAVTVEYDTVGRQDAIMIVPFPNDDPDDGRTVRIAGSIEEGDLPPNFAKLLRVGFESKALLHLLADFTAGL